MELVLVFAAVFAGPALVVGGIASAIARWTGARRGESTEAIGRRIRRAFWVSVLITVGIELLVFGLCVAAFQVG